MCHPLCIYFRDRWTSRWSHSSANVVSEFCRQREEDGPRWEWGLTTDTASTTALKMWSAQYCYNEENTAADGNRRHPRLLLLLLLLLAAEEPVAVGERTNELTGWMVVRLKLAVGRPTRSVLSISLPRSEVSSLLSQSLNDQLGLLKLHLASECLREYWPTVDEGVTSHLGDKLCEFMYFSVLKGKVF